MDYRAEYYRIAVEDERHYRDAVQSRIAYHTSVMIALVAALGAGVFQGDTPLEYAVVSIGGFLLSWMGVHSRQAIERIYIHFLEAVRVRETIEMRLGLRAAPTSDEERVELGLPTSAAAAEPNWLFPPLYSGSWLGKRAIPPHTGGYYDHTARLFRMLSLSGLATGATFGGVALWSLQTPRLVCFLLDLALGR